MWYILVILERCHPLCHANIYAVQNLVAHDIHLLTTWHNHSLAYFPSFMGLSFVSDKSLECLLLQHDLPGSCLCLPAAGCRLIARLFATNVVVQQWSGSGGRCVGRYR